MGGDQPLNALVDLPHLQLLNIHECTFAQHIQPVVSRLTNLTGLMISVGWPNEPAQEHDVFDLRAASRLTSLRVCLFGCMVWNTHHNPRCSA